MMSLWQGRASITGEDGRFDPSGAGEWFRTGIGRIERSSMQRGVEPGEFELCTGGSSASLQGVRLTVR